MTGNTPIQALTRDINAVFFQVRLSLKTVGFFVVDSIWIKDLACPFFQQSHCILERTRLVEQLIEYVFAYLVLLTLKLHIIII